MQLSNLTTQILLVDMAGMLVQIEHKHPLSKPAMNKPVDLKMYSESQITYHQYQKARKALYYYCICKRYRKFRRGIKKLLHCLERGRYKSVHDLMDDFLEIYSRIFHAGLCPWEFLVCVSADIYHATTGTIVLERVDKKWKDWDGYVDVDKHKDVFSDNENEEKYFKDEREHHNRAVFKVKEHPLDIDMANEHDVAESIENISGDAEDRLSLVKQEEFDSD